MPNRILKESICTSSTIDGLSVASEIFFYRLLVQCDDYGRMDARVPLLRAKCYPLRLHSITDGDVSEYLSELNGAGLIWTYESDGHPYLQITKWHEHQQIRAKRSKYPEPPETRYLKSSEINGNQPKSGREENSGPGNHLQSDVPVIQSESESESNPNPITGAGAPASQNPESEELDLETAPLTAGQNYFLKQFGAKRFKLRIQRATIGNLERQHGTDKLRQCIDWAAKKGLGMGDAIGAIEKAITTWGNGHTLSAARGGGAQGKSKPDLKSASPVEDVAKLRARIQAAKAGQK